MSARGIRKLVEDLVAQRFGNGRAVVADSEFHDARGAGLNQNAAARFDMTEGVLEKVLNDTP